tara:strand:- start:8206 stop:8664 length:459 start_codon:yes stop_codon:yes gene_type:complete
MKNIYCYDEYFRDISKLAVRYSNHKNPHIVSVDNQSLPASVHLSNLLKCPMSILSVKDGEALWVMNNTENRDIRPKQTSLFPFLICMDTVYREDVFTAIKQLPEFINNPNYVFYTIFGHNNDLRVYYTHEMIYKSISFPWQRGIEKNDLIIE